MSPSECLIAPGMGAVIGGGYGLQRVRSPAPSITAQVGPLGILSGECRVRNFMGTSASPANERGADVESQEPGEPK